MLEAEVKPSFRIDTILRAPDPRSQYTPGQAILTIPWRDHG
jgi:hypothetical protein